ncbi:hypothetical protein [Phosphitispora sp. TUW77]|uniref:hypothetical protein n=1 Tax=Phosphitispora sp. TUW77 TaxID=3152361 RepID=UPI003AB5FE90
MSLKTSFKMVMLMAVICIIIVFSGQPAQALQVKLIDSCIGVDHPPFQQDYSGDGLSYLNVGLTLPLEAFEGKTITGTLTGNGETVEAVGEVDDSGRVFLSFSLYSYGNYEVKIIDETGSLILEQTVAVGPEESACALEGLAKAQPPQAEQEPVREPEPEPKSESKPELDSGADVTSVPGGEFTWWVLIGIGLLIGAAGLILMRSHRCEKEFQAWLDAERRLLEARAAAANARTAAEQTATAKSGIEAELADVRRSYPSAGKPGGGEAWVEMDGKRITSRDVALRREAEQAAWEKYRENPSPESAADLEEAWRDANTPESEEERREIDERARDLERQLEEARDAENDARRRAADAERDAERAAGAADAARLVYEECIGKASAPAGTEGAGTGTGDDGTKVSTDGADAAETRERRCREDDPSQERNIRELGIVNIPVRLDVNIAGGGAHDAAREAKEISGRLADASEKLGWLSKAMDIKGIGSSLMRDRSGWKALGAGGAPLAGTISGTPVPTSPGQAAVDFLSVTAGIASVIIGKVPELQERRLPDCELTITIYNRVMRATCAEVWVCRDGQWVQDGTRFKLTVIRENHGRRYWDAFTWAQAQREIEKWEDIQMARLQRAMDELARLEARCGP